MSDSKRHLVLLSLVSLCELFAVLIFPKHFTLIFTASLVTAVALFFVFFSKKQFSTAVFFLAAILFFAVNPYRVYLDKEQNANNLISSAGQKKVTCTAIVSECNHYSANSVIFADITSVNGNDLGRFFPARITSFTAGGIADGDTIVFEGKMLPLSDINKTDFDTATYLRSKNTFIEIQSAKIISSVSPESISFLKKLQQYTKNYIYKYTHNGYDYTSSSVATAMFAGDTDYIPADTKEAFRQSGLTHVLCVSGMHLTVITGVIFSLLSVFTLHNRLKCIIVMALCLIYALFTGFSPSAVRACIMCIISFFALMTGRKTDGFITLFFAVFVICIFSPYSILDISLMLSFSACLGILVFSEIIPSYSGKNKILKYTYRIAQALLTNFGAVFFTLPISAFFFGRMSHFSIISTLFVSFACEILLTALLVMMLLSPLSCLSFTEPIVSSLGTVCRGLTSFIVKTAEFFSEIPYSYTGLDKNSGRVFFTIFIFLLIITTAFIYLDIKRVRFFCAASVMTLGIIFSFISLNSAINLYGEYGISYFRQNENDRQLSIRLNNQGYLIVNADSNLCCDKTRADFDTSKGRNYLLLIPDESTNVKVLCNSIKNFDSQYGIKKIFIPRTGDGAELILQLSENGFSSFFMPKEVSFGRTTLEFYSGDFHRIVLADNKTRSEVVFADSYKPEYFGSGNDICAFFTRKTANQFKADKDTAPECDIFFTRMGRDDYVHGIQNTFNKRHFTIKE